MNRQHALILIGGAFVLAGLVLATHPLQPAFAAVERVDAGFDLARLGSGDLNLQCNVKAANGLAQCGSQASSCKNCHEVKGEDPVNTQGEWHISHAFGDFCEFCHGGNVQAVDKAAAHEGLVQPLDDVKTNCSSCHGDYEDRAQIYATALGVTVGTGGSGGSSQSPSQPSGSSEPSAPSAAAAAPLPSGSEIVDYVAQYTSGDAAADPVNIGNLVIGGLLVLAVVGGGAFVYWNEKRLRRTASPKVAAPVAATVAPNGDKSEPADLSVPAGALGELKPDLVRLLPTLQSLDPRTLRALKIILSDRKRGEEVLQSLSLVNFGVLEEMKRLDKRELSLLLALAGEA